MVFTHTEKGAAAHQLKIESPDMSSEDEILFTRWVIKPLEALRTIPDGDGAFGALAIAFGLYERFLASRIHKRGDAADDGARYEEASDDFGRKVSPEDFKRFWEMYRVGIQHYFHPKHFVKGGDQTRWGWDMSENAGYEAYPIIISKEADLSIITINPWAFAFHVVDRWKRHPELMDELSATKLGEVRTPPASRPQPPKPTQEFRTCTESPMPQSHNWTGKWPG